MNRKSLFISMSLAILVALLASRVNRPAVVEAPRREAVLEEVIADVEIDTRTFQRAVNSLGTRTVAKLVIDGGLLPAVEAEETERSREEPRKGQRFTNVRLGMLVARLLDQWGDELPMDWRIDGQTITFFRPPAEPAMERRVYDLRSFKRDWMRWRDLAARWEPPRQTGGGGGLFGGGGSRYQSDDEIIVNRLIEFFRDQAASKRSEECRVIARWAGWVTIEAPVDLHDSFARFLAIWEQRVGPPWRLAMKATIIGTLSGISAAIVMMLLNQRPAAPAIREIPVYGQGPSPKLAERFLASTSPSADAAKLRRILPRVKCDKMRLEEFVAWIADATGTNIYVEWHEMAGGAAAGPDSKVTLDLRNARASAALQLALDQSEGVGLPLGFVWVDGVVKVSLAKRLDHYAMVRVYDVRDLIVEAVKIGGAARKAKNPKPEPEDRFAIPNFEEFKTREGEAADMLRNILIRCLNDEAWGDSREINYFAGRLVISQTAHNHELISAMLAALRAKPE